MELSLLSVRTAEAMIMVTNVSAIPVTKSLTGTDACQPNLGSQISNGSFINSKQELVENIFDAFRIEL